MGDLMDLHDAGLTVEQIVRLRWIRERVPDEELEAMEADAVPLDRFIPPAAGEPPKSEHEQGC